MWMAIRVFKWVLENLRRSKKVSSQKSGSNYLQYFGGMYKEPSRGRLNVLIVQICLTAKNLSAESSLGNATCLLWVSRSFHTFTHRHALQFYAFLHCYITFPLHRGCGFISLVLVANGQQRTGNKEKHHWMRETHEWQMKWNCNARHPISCPRKQGWQRDYRYGNHIPPVIPINKYCFVGYLVTWGVGREEGVKENKPLIWFVVRRLLICPSHPEPK